MKPFILQCSDYHDFDLVKYGVDCATGKKSKFKEITLLFDGGNEYDPYWAIFYIDKCPIEKKEYRSNELKKLGVNICEY